MSEVNLDRAATFGLDFAAFMAPEGQGGDVGAEQRMRFRFIISDFYAWLYVHDDVHETLLLNEGQVPLMGDFLTDLNKYTIHCAGAACEGEAVPVTPTAFEEAVIAQVTAEGAGQASGEAKVAATVAHLNKLKPLYASGQHLHRILREIMNLAVCPEDGQLVKWQVLEWLNMYIRGIDSATGKASETHAAYVDRRSGGLEDMGGVRMAVGLPALLHAFSSGMIGQQLTPHEADDAMLEACYIASARMTCFTNDLVDTKSIDRDACESGLSLKLTDIMKQGVALGCLSVEEAQAEAEAVRKRCCTCDLPDIAQMDMSDYHNHKLVIDHFIPSRLGFEVHKVYHGILVETSRDLLAKTEHYLHHATNKAYAALIVEYMLRMNYGYVTLQPSCFRYGYAFNIYLAAAYKDDFEEYQSAIAYYKSNESAVQFLGP